MRFIIVLLSLVYTFGYSQNNQVLYNFAELPQTLLLNPGAEFTKDAHIGIPLLSKISMHGGFTGFTAYDIFIDDGVNINTKIRAAINNYGKYEILGLNEQIEIFSGGYKLKNEDYLSFGFYQELDVFAKIPRDIVDLFYEGNTDLYRHYAIDNFSTRAEMLGVLHLGLTRTINNQWQVGARAKIYSSAFNIKSYGATGSFYTEDGVNNIYKQYLENVDILVQTSGLIINDNDEFSTSDITKGILFGGSLGLGLDLGFTHHLDDQLIISGSMLDIGFITIQKM